MIEEAKAPLERIERTLVLVKPDGVRRRLVGTIIRWFEKTGFALVGLKLIQPTRQRVDAHLPRSAEWFNEVGTRALEWCREKKLNPIEIYGSDVSVEIGRAVRNWNFAYLTSGPIVALVLEGEEAVAAVRQIVGHSFPDRARRGTIRCDFGQDTASASSCEHRACRNVAHASSDLAEAEREIRVWFSPGELLSSEELHQPVS